MPTVISHSLVAIVIGKVFSKSTGVKFWAFSIICVILPDIDVFLYIFDISHISMLEHRGIMHSMSFALVIAFIIVTAGFREIKHFSKEWWSFFAYFFFIGLSHGILDAMTTGGQGVGFFMPFISTRYFFPIRPIRVSPFRLMHFFESEGGRILMSESFWIWLPSIAILCIIGLVKSEKNLNLLKKERQAQTYQEKNYKKPQ
jgi:inner membrane protein